MMFDGPYKKVEIDPALVTHVATTEDPNMVAVYYTADNAYQFGRAHVRGSLAGVRAALGLPPPPGPRLT